MTKEFTLFSLALRNLKRKPLRSGILIVAIGLLVSVLVFALSFVKRVDSGIKITSDRLGADLLIVPTGSRGFAEDVLLESKVKTFYMDKGIIGRVKEIEGRERTDQIYLATITGACCDIPELGCCV
jgi:putative ABC transport system permease protein